MSDKCPENHLPKHFWSIPDMAKCMMTRKQLRETLLDTGGTIIARGHFREIGHKHLGAGAYEVFLKEKK